MDTKKLNNGLDTILQEKGTRKFTQSVEVIFNFRGVDFNKAENRVNLDVFLPKGMGGKEPKVAIIAEENIASEYKKAGAELIILPNEIPAYAAPDKLKMLVRDYVLLAQPNQMANVAKNLGKYLGPRGKMPRPLIDKGESAVKKAKSSVKLVSKGKYLPVLQAFVGTENMSPQDLKENIEAVYEAIKNKVTEPCIKSIYVKMTMSKATKVM